MMIILSPLVLLSDVIPLRQIDQIYNRLGREEQMLVQKLYLHREELMLKLPRCQTVITNIASLKRRRPATSCRRIRIVLAYFVRKTHRKFVI